jgi:hypothetical protein
MTNELKLAIDVLKKEHFEISNFSMKHKNFDPLDINELSNSIKLILNTVTRLYEEPAELKKNSYIATGSMEDDYENKTEAWTSGYLQGNSEAIDLATPIVNRLKQEIKQLENR